MPSLEVRTRIATSADLAFDLSLNVAEHMKSMAANGDRVLTVPRGGVLELNDQVTWQARHFRFDITMTSAIIEHDWPHRFVDTQVHGPFAAYRHEHMFLPIDNDIEMIDMVEYSWPGGLLGRGADRLFLKRYLTELIEDRGAYLKRVLESKT